MKKCACALTPDGECESCRAQAFTAGTKLQDLLRDLMPSVVALENELYKKIEELKTQWDIASVSFDAAESCSRCAHKYVDFALSKMILGFRNKNEIRFAEAFVKKLEKTFAKRGIKLPLTKRAWAKINN